MFKLKKINLYLSTLIITANLFANSLLLSFNQREEYVLSKLKKSYLEEISNIKKELEEFDNIQIETKFTELQNHILKTTEKIKTENQPETLKKLKETEQNLKCQIEQLTQKVFQIALKRQIMQKKEIQFDLINIGITILNNSPYPKKKSEKILSKESIDDLGLFDIVNSESSLYKNIDQTISSLGKIQLALELDIKKQNKEKLEKKAAQINEILNNEELFNSLSNKLQTVTKYIEDYLKSITQISIEETQINAFMQSSENKFSYYIKPAIWSGITTTTTNISRELLHNLSNKTIINTIKTANSILFNTNKLESIKNLINNFTAKSLGDFINYSFSLDLLKKAFSSSTIYKNWNLYTATFSYLLSKKIFKTPFSKLNKYELKNILPVGFYMTSNYLIQKYFEIPHILANIITTPFYGIVAIKNSIQNKYQIKQKFKNEILQKFYNLNNLFSQLEDLIQISESNTLIKTFIKNIKKLIEYNQDNSISTFIKAIKNTENYEKYKNKEILQSLYKTYVSIFIKMENPKYKKLISKALKDFGKIDVLLSKAKLCNNHNYTVPKYINSSDTAYIYFKNKSKPNLDETIIKLDKCKFQGLKNNLKTFTYNLILSQIGLSKSEEAKITPIDKILTMLNNNKIENFNDMINRIYKLNPSEKTIIIIDNTNLENLSDSSNFAEKITSDKLLNVLENQLAPSLPNTHILFSII